jgi:hypothetical protein
MHHGEHYPTSWLGPLISDDPLKFLKRYIRHLRLSLDRTDDNDGESNVTDNVTVF